jgi:uncharacterized protein YqhQ
MEKINVGGQAVLEGVMMLAPNALAVAVRRPDGQIVFKEGPPWRLLSARYPWLKWPFIRGIVALIESLVNGIGALTFSANASLEGEEEEEELGAWALVATIALAFVLGILLFVALPHYLSYFLGQQGPFNFGVESLAFHTIDGIIKLAVFFLYLWMISMIKDIARVFEYHGAEHKTIYTYEAGQELTVENARQYTTLHPRCGTAFLIVVLMISIILFAVVFPLIAPKPEEAGLSLHLFFVGVKILLMFPIAGSAYELNRYASRHMDIRLLKLAILPGLWVQKLTTREPSDDQLEIAISALEKALAVENSKAD